MTSAILTALRTHAEADPDRVALSGDQVVTYGELWRRVQQVATWLRAQPITRAALSGENGADWIVADLAAWLADVLLVPLPSFFSPAQRRHLLENTGVQGVIVCGEAAGQPIAPGLGFERLPASASPPILPSGVCKITYTSGTTESPKGVCLDSAMLDAVARALAARIHAAPGMAEAIEVHFVLMPLSTLLENVAGVYVPLLLGKRIVVRAGSEVGLSGSSRLDVARLLQALAAARPHSLIVAPQILYALVVAAEQGMDPPDSLRFVAVGGAATPPALLDRACAAGIPAFEGYGLSECASVVALNAPGSLRAGSVGRPLDHVRVRVRDGVIEVAGNVFAGYVGQAASAHAEWLDTGDLGRLDDDGFLYVTGRRKNVIITGFGRNVSPEWIEGRLASSASIAQVVVVGEGRAFLAAIVVPTPGADAARIAQDLRSTNATLPDYARIGRFLIADEAFTPANGLSTDNGRPRRVLIAARFATRIAALYDAAPSHPTAELLHDLVL